MSTYKSTAIMRELVDVLTKELASLASPITFVANTFDANSNPVVTFSQHATPVAGERNVVIRVQPIAVLATDSLGNAANNYQGHIIQICTEANYAGTTDNVADILTPAQLTPVLVECGRRGSFVEWYVSANGTVPSTAQMTAGNKQGDWKNLYWNVLAAG